MLSRWVHVERVISLLMKFRLPFLGSILERRHGGVLLLVGMVMTASMLTRIALFLQSLWSFDYGLGLVSSVGWGLLFDFATALLLTCPVAVLLLVLPAGIFRRQWARAVAHFSLWAATAGLLFIAASEWFFWDEFSTRFNFIAVDYLIYTQEVIANIRESYPMPAIFAGIGLVSALLYAGLLRTGWVDRWLDGPDEPFKKRLVGAGCWLLPALVLGTGLSLSRLPAFPNTYNRELAQNGIWSFFAAFRSNELNYQQFYPTLPESESFTILHRELAKDGSTIPPGTSVEDTLRWIDNPGDELHPNIIQITVESLSAKFLGVFNEHSKLTPNLDALAEKSLFFEQFYATGTRTDRGMEALTLSIPPTPGRSLIKRPNNAGLFTLGSVLRTRGYDTAFIYGGNGYFDNMNTYFGGNGYRVIDRPTKQDSDVTFANAWGACDEDLFNWTLTAADESVATGKPFHYFVMTTSNHRPYTFPDGRIDLPSGKSGRKGAVKYTDYAIGKFLQDASSKPWFKNTIFVIVADHCASVAGKTELPVENYQIPLFIYAPGGQIAPGRVKEVCSQIDYAPTLLGLLHWSYPSRFYGGNVLAEGAAHRALIGNYQKLGLYEDGHLTVLKPVRQEAQYNFDAETTETTSRSLDRGEVDLAISYYESASRMFKKRTYLAFTADELEAFSGRAKIK